MDAKENTNLGTNSSHEYPSEITCVFHTLKYFSYFK